MPSSQKLQIWLKQKCTWMFIRWSSTNCTFFVPIWNSKWHCGGGHLGFPIDIKNIKFVEDLPMIIPGLFGFNCPSGFREEAFWNIFPIGSNVKLSKCFFSETTWTIETKLPRNNHWKVLYRMFVLYADRKSKMATTAIHRLTLNPMGKCSNAMNIHVQFGFNHICSFWEEGIWTFSHRVQC
jgi:hypothetical protein